MRLKSSISLFLSVLALFGYETKSAGIPILTGFPRCKFKVIILLNPCALLCIPTINVTLAVNSVQAASRHTEGST